MQYTARENDANGLYYYRARYYDPVLKRFISEDPIGLQGGSLSFYAYVNGDPISYVDPEGLRASFCRRPLGDYSGKNGAGYPLQLNHSFICVTLSNGTVRCDSTNNPDDDASPMTPAPGVPSKPERDNEQNSVCKNIDDDKDRCFEDCVLEQWSKPRPPYAVGPLGTDCHEYNDSILKICRKRCPSK